MTTASTEMLTTGQGRCRELDQHRIIICTFSNTWKEYIFFEDEKKILLRTAFDGFLEFYYF